MTALRTLLAVVIVLIAPGYLLLRALFPAGGPRDAERVALVIGCSVAVSVVAGLVLALTPRGITGAGMDWTLGVTVVALAVIAAVRAPRGRHGGLPGWRKLGRRGVLVAWHGAPWAIAGLLGATALVIVRDSARTVSRRASFTQLWLVPYGTGAQLGVTSFEHGEERYRLTVTAGRRVIVRSAVTLTPGSTYTRQVALTPASVTKRIDARLFVGDSTRPYRMVSWGRTPAGGR